MAVIEWFLWLIAYSFIGWVYESLICSIGQLKFVNRGFLNGPICPVYGFGALAAIAFLYQKTDNLLILFVAGMLLTCTVEYFTAVLLEKLFHAKWWDYSHYRFNLQGRVSLLGAVVFGTLSVLLIKYVHPLVSGAIIQLQVWPKLILALILFTLILLDLYVTVRHLLLLNNRLKEIQAAINTFWGQYAKRYGALKDSLTEKFEESEFYNEHIKTLFNVSRFQNIRLIRAFPRLRPLNYGDAWQKLKGILLGGEDIK